MSITLDQIIQDAKRVANRVKDLEALSNALLVEAEGNNRQIETMKQFHDDLDSLNKLARNKTNTEMVNRVNQQNPSLREFRHENRELKATLEDHQRALEIIMHKYREQVQHKVFTSRINFKEIYNAKLQEIINKQQEKINEMAAVMQKAASIDDDVINNEIELIARLKIENQGLREMLQISRQFGTTTSATAEIVAEELATIKSATEITTDAERIGYDDKSVQTELNSSLIGTVTAAENLYNNNNYNNNNDNTSTNDKNDNEITKTLKNIKTTDNDANDNSDQVNFVKNLKETKPAIATVAATTVAIPSINSETVVDVTNKADIGPKKSSSSSQAVTVTTTVAITDVVESSSSSSSVPPLSSPLLSSSTSLPSENVSIPIVNGENGELKIKQEQVS